jgi:uncharacterized protein
MADPHQIIRKYYPADSVAAHILTIHSEAVARKAAIIAEHLNLSPETTTFIHEASLLHDIGIIFTHAPSIGCYGEHPYICHGFKGHDLLVGEDLPLHALVCERHTGTGLTIEDIDNQHLPLPRRMMVPVSLPERIIAYSDKFFSKDPQKLQQEKSVDEVVASMRRFGPDKEAKFLEWHQEFHR